MRSIPLQTALAGLCTLLPLDAALHTVSGCIKDESGAPAGGVIVYVEEVDGYPKYSMTADAKGCYRQTLLPDGYYEIRAERSGAMVTQKNINLDKPGNATVNLQFAPHRPARAAVPPMIDLEMLARPGASGQAESASALLKSVSFTLKVIDAGDHVMGTVQLSRAAPAGGWRVRLSVSRPFMALVPAEVTIPEGSLTVSFSLAATLVCGPSDIYLAVRAADGETARSAELTVRSHTRLTVRLAGAGRGRVTSIPPGIDCESDVCTAPFPDGETVKLIVHAEAGAEFGGWSGDCGADGVVVVSSPVSCTAAFLRK